MGRNLLFLGVLFAAGLALTGSLFPLFKPSRVVKFDAGPVGEPDFRSVVREVDAAFREEWASKGLTPAPPADDLIVARRISLALTGMVPSLEEIRQFEAQPTNNRLAGWTGHLLQDRRFANYFADRFSHFLVGVEEGPLIVYRKRRFEAWLSDQFKANTPYGEMARQMIAESGLNTDRPAVNFIAATYVDERKAPDAEKLAIRVTRAFLGLRLDCAQCHDHFLEPTWKQTDFQALAAFFGQTRQIVTHIDDGSGEYEYDNRKDGTKVTIDPGVPFLPELLPAEGTRRERLAAWLTDRRNVYFARATVNRVWALMFNRPLLKRVEAQSLNEPVPAALTILARDFAAHNYDLHRLIRLIAATEVFRLDSAAPFEITEAHDKAWAAFPVTRLRPEQVIGGVIQSASVQTINQNSHIVTRLFRYTIERDFVKRYGETGDDEFDNADGTIPQRLLMMNGGLVQDRANEELGNASRQIAMMAPDDRTAIEVSYLTVLSRRPSPKELEYFLAKLEGKSGDVRNQCLSDLFWALYNSTEMSWNH